MSTASPKTPDPLLAQLYGFRRHVVVVKITEALIAATFAFFAAWLVVMVVERFTELVPWQRFGLLMIGAAGFGITFPKAVHRWVWKTRAAESIAKLLANRFPLLADEILGVLEFSLRNRQGASQRLIDAAIEQTAQEAACKDFKEATPTHQRAVWATLAIGTLLASGVAMGLFPAAAQNAWQRFLNPWTDTARFTFAKLAPLDDEKIVPYGEAFELRVELAQESINQPPQAIATMGITKVEARLDGNGYSFEMPGQSSTGELEVKAGDSNRKLKIVPKTRPELVDITGEVRLPEYLHIAEPQRVRSLTGRFSVLEGSRAKFKINANRELFAASMDGQPMAVNQTTAITREFNVQDQAEFQFQWQDQFGLDASEPGKLEIRPTPDRSPECTLERIDNPVVLWEKMLRLRFSAIDDFGLKYIGIQWEGIADPVDNPNPVRGEKILFAGGPTENSIQSDSVLTPKREEIAPQLLTLRLFTQDFRPGSPRVYSTPQTVHVMSAAQHVAWLAEQMKRWQSKADAIYERELALHDENKRLQSLSDQELAQDENIRRLEQQAASERDNSQRLAHAISEGVQLVKQALQNKEMRADQVARWSDALTRLKNIANNRMPDLSRKLDQLARDLASRKPSANLGDPSPVETSDFNDDQESSDSRNQASGDLKTDESDKEAEQTADETEKKTLPDLNHQEDSMLDDQNKDRPKEKQDNGGERMTIPQTMLQNPKQKPQPEQGEAKDQQESPDDSPPKIDEVVENQDRLIEEFRKARESMEDLVAEFENTTFVRRLKAASQAQLRIASQLNASMSQLFGVDKEPTAADADFMRRISAAQNGMFEDLCKIGDDLNAFQSRELDEARQQILDEMQSLNMRVKLEEMPLRLERRLNGDALHRTEFWADTFDRWAEELIPPSGGGGGGGGGGRPSLPPSIILEVMRLIEDETQLRDETRSLHQARNAMESTETEERLAGLTIYQMSLQERTLDAVDDVKRLPNSSSAYREEIEKLTDAVDAMAEASSMLVDGTTGDPTVGAETAAIEALLTARRNQPNGGTPTERDEGAGDGSESLAALESPFDIIRPSVGTALNMTPRDVGAATSNVNDRIPEAYRSGIDAFRNQLRKLEQMN